MSHAFAADPAIAARWRDPAARAELAARWREHRSLRIAGALEPGIAAELAARVAALPVVPVADPAGNGVWWGCTVALPPLPDPQLPECFYRIVRFFDDDLPELARAITGRRLAPPRRGRFDVRIWRKGSFADGAPLVPPAALEAVLGLTAASWPEAWGGSVELLDADGAVIERRPPGFDTLDLTEGTPPMRTTLLTRHVAVLTVHGLLEEPA
jgi:hypothetical protein